jgi:hypothetical protein
VEILCTASPVMSWYVSEARDLIGVEIGLVVLRGFVSNEQ